MWVEGWVGAQLLYKLDPSCDEHAREDEDKTIRHSGQ